MTITLRQLYEKGIIDPQDIVYITVFELSKITKHLGKNWEDYLDDEVISIYPENEEGFSLDLSRS